MREKGLMTLGTLLLCISLVACKMDPGQNKSKVNVNEVKGNFEKRGWEITSFKGAINDFVVDIKSKEEEDRNEFPGVVAFEIRSIPNIEEVFDKNMLEEKEQVVYRIRILSRHYVNEGTEQEFVTLLFGKEDHLKPFGLEYARDDEVKGKTVVSCGINYDDSDYFEDDEECKGKDEKRAIKLGEDMNELYDEILVEVGLTRETFIDWANVYMVEEYIKFKK